ncbi:MAG: DUF1579 domain-containing protein [Pyrinomonadaceae bacterium]|nr:DUF1579 domain-containing protein [Sphingobacteriaceae bacterium]
MKNLVKGALIVLGVFSCTNLLAQSENSKPKSAAMEAGEKAWMEYMTPGMAHQMLAKSDGEWQEELTFWMEPGAEPVKSKTTAVNKMIMDGRYQHSTHTGLVMGMPFEGIGITGYDNAKKMFVSNWIDNMGTGMMYSEGKWNEANKTIEFKGMAVDPVSGKELKVRQVLKLVDANTETMEMFTTKDGKEFKSMEIKMTRKM